MKKNNILNTLVKRCCEVALAVSLFLILATGAVCAQTPKQWKQMKGDVCLFMANDMGRNGYYDQKPIAEMMGQMAETLDPECVIAAGDVHHFNGVASVDDPLWMTNYELIYSHPELMIDWFPVLGNHEYRGNTQAVMDYAKRSRRWMAGERYYSRVFSGGKQGVSVRVVFIDTTPLIDRYRENQAVYPDAAGQSRDRQLCWLDSLLSVAKEDWIVVVGHHPVYAQTTKAEYEREDMQKYLLPVLRKHKNVDVYACGHIHNFQHIRHDGDAIDYLVNSSGSLARKVKPTDGTVFCSPEAGFSVISASKKHLKVYLIDKAGQILHSIKRAK